MNFHFTSNGHFGLVSPSPDVISLGKTNSVKLCHTKPVPFPSEKKDRKNETLGQNLSAKDPSHTVRHSSPRISCLAVTVLAVQDKQNKEGAVPGLQFVHPDTRTCMVY